MTKIYGIEFEDGHDADTDEDTTGEDDAETVAGQYGLEQRGSVLVCESREEAQEMAKLLRPGYNVSVIEVPQD
jgi:hypothetical protein